jgi:DNA-binding transcriptional LysR family regulator
MNLDLIDTFLDLLETGNFNRTAERLETTQSTISGRVEALEQAVGAKLFQRGRAGAIPTPSGLRFEQHARALKAGWAHARRDIGGLERYEGSLRVSGQFSLMRTLFLGGSRHHLSYIERENPRAAVHVDEEIVSAVRRLLDFPESGRPGRVARTRELVIPRSPYIAAYMVMADRIRILRVCMAPRRAQRVRQRVEAASLISS